MFKPPITHKPLNALRWVHGPGLHQASGNKTHLYRSKYAIKQHRDDLM